MDLNNKKKAVHSNNDSNPAICLFQPDVPQLYLLVMLTFHSTLQGNTEVHITVCLDVVENHQVFAIRYDHFAKFNRDLYRADLIICMLFVPSQFVYVLGCR